MQLAPADEPLGRLQRGLGSGALWVRSAPPEEAREALLQCILADPRRDRQIDRRNDYYAQLAIAVELDVAPLDERLRTAQPDPGGDDRDLTFVFGVLGAMAARGHGEARRVLRAYVSYGHRWDELLHDLGVAGALEGVDDMLVRRFGTTEALADALQWTWASPSDEPWRTWLTNPHLAAAWAVVQSRHQEEAPRTPPKARPASLPTAELLSDPDLTVPDHAARELVRRTGPTDRELLQTAALDPTHPMHPAAVMALAAQGDEDVYDPALALMRTGTGFPRRMGRAALQAMPATRILPLARENVGHGEAVMRRLGAAILRRHGLELDLELSREVLAAELDRAEDGDDYVICDLAGAIARHADFGPFEELDRAYREMGYSYGRRFIIEAIAASDPTFPSDLAVEILWDCEAETRTLGAELVDRTVRAAAQRLHELHADEHEDDRVREAATRQTTPTR